MSESLRFGYSRSLAPTMWVFVALAAIELFVVHFLVSIWSVTAALILSVLTLAAMAWLVALVLSFKRRPVIVERGVLLFRTGTLMSMRVDPADVAAVRRDFSSEALKRRGVLDFAMLSYPNILVELRRPVQRGRKRPVDGLAHCLDDPDGFAVALNRLVAGAEPC
jgi:hypothetical protein